MTRAKRKEAPMPISMVQVSEQKDLLLVVDSGFDGALKAAAAMLSRPLDTPILAGVFARIKKAAENLEALDTAAKRLVQDVLQREGTVVTDKGTRELVVAGWRLRVQPTRTGLDPKKVEASIRAKGKDPSGYMRATVSYSVTDRTAEVMRSNGWTDAELASLHYDATFAVQKPVRVDEDSSGG